MYYGTVLHVNRGSCIVDTSAPVTSGTQPSAKPFVSAPTIHKDVMGSMEQFPAWNGVAVRWDSGEETMVNEWELDSADASASLVQTGESSSAIQIPCDNSSFALCARNVYEIRRLNKK